MGTGRFKFSPRYIWFWRSEYKSKKRKARRTAAKFQRPIAIASPEDSTREVIVRMAFRIELFALLREQRRPRAGDVYLRFHAPHSRAGNPGPVHARRKAKGLVNFAYQNGIAADDAFEELEQHWSIVL